MTHRWRLRRPPDAMRWRRVEDASGARPMLEESDAGFAERGYRRHGRARLPDVCLRMAYEGVRLHGHFDAGNPSNLTRGCEYSTAQLRGTPWA